MDNSQKKHKKVVFLWITLKSGKMSRMERPPLETIIARIRDGKTYREIGAEFGVSHSTIVNWLSDNDQSARAKEAALLDSAEAWLDRGIDYLESALSKESGIDPSAARALAQECARRAAVRNPKYRDKSETTLKGDAENPVMVRLTFG